MREHLRRNVVGYVAVFLALTATATALPGRNSVNSKDIIDGEVKRPDVAINAVTAAKVADDVIASPEVVNDSLTGDDVAASAIGAGELTSGSVGTSEVMNDSLDGNDIDEFGLSVDAMGCKPGLVLGFARIKGDPDMPSTPTSSSTWIDHDRTCRALSGYQVTVERTGTGSYVADFWPPGFPISISLAVATADATDDLACEDNIASVRVLSEGRVVVRSFDNDGDAQDCWVSLVVL